MGLLKNIRNKLFPNYSRLDESNENEQQKDQPSSIEIENSIDSESSSSSKKNNLNSSSSSSGITGKKESDIDYNEYYDRNRYNDPSPEQHANIFSRISFWWVRPTLKRGYRKPLELTDIPEQVDSIKCAQSVPLMEGIDFTAKYPLIKHIYLNYSTRYKIIALLKFLSIAASIITPLLLRTFVLFINGETDLPSYFGWLLCIALFFSSCVQSMGLQQGYWYGLKMCLEMKGALMSTIFRKMLKLSNSSKRKYTGKIMNLISVDVENFQEYFWNSHVDIIVYPLQIVLLLILLCMMLGPSGLAGFVVMGLSVPCSTLFITKANNYFLSTLQFSDQRVRLISEFICGIRFLKLYNWENSFVNRITDQRNYQLNTNKKKLFFWAMDQANNAMLNGVVLLVTFSFYTLLGNQLDASTAFTAISIFVSLRNPTQFAPESIQKFLRVSSSARRIEEYLQANEISLNSQNLTSSSPSGSPTLFNSSGGVGVGGTQEIRIVNGEFNWDDSFASDFVDSDGAKSPSKQARSKILQTEESGADADDSGLLRVDSSLGIEMEEISNSVLTNVNFVAPKGKLTVIVGRVGCGKTSLISAILGEISRVAGTVSAPKNLGYTPQMPWLISGTFRDNITFGQPFDMDRYIKVIQACCLKQDLAMFPAKDMTEIGEHGINLSGGQRQRISLARCLYSNADAYVMDEPLSAVDAEVGKHLFDHCIQEMMGDKTRVLVTHQLQFIPSADHIVVIENGNLIQGTYQELSAKGIDFESIMKTKQLDLEEEEGQQPQQPTSSSAPAVVVENPLNKSTVELENNQCIVMDANESDPIIQKGKLFVVEERGKGAIGSSTYIPYFKSGGSTLFYVTIILLYFFSQLIMQSSDYWLVIWTGAKIQPDPGNKFYLLIYGAFVGTFVLLLVCRLLGISNLCWTASKRIHQRLVGSVFFSPTSFFDQNPSGRILNRFSKDTSDIDNNLLESINDVLNCGSSVLVSIILMIYLTPYIIFAFVGLVGFYYYIQKFYRCSSRELKRMESISRSPIFGSLGESFTGLVSIRIFKQQERFIDLFDQHINLNQRLFYHSFSVNRWLGMHLELLTSLMVVSASVFSLISASKSPGVAGMAVSSAISVTGILNWAIRQFTELEVKMNSVERVMEYINSPNEGDRIIEDHRPPEDWPTKGEIKFRNVEVRYRPHMDPSLRELNCTVNAGEKIGIVGRTGAGKSTIGLSLFRMATVTKGSIIIDGIDIESIGLDDLRGRLAVIPQDPFIFSGSIRMNLDPFNQHSDPDIWTALEAVHIKPVVEAFPLKLEYELDQGGDGLSIGQKQLLCLARALLSKSPIVLMDEATASLDYETDAIIKETIRTNFANRTVLTIAHRLDTIIDSDKVMVVDKGRLIEYDSPKALISTNSRFRQLVDAQSTFLYSNFKNQVENLD
ncbi:hypothetical protein PPL_04616 [Heterostelium album PN500]|uniref:Uncharacterized protein n=1 Tax=Heterostelium pallidum (strain ATCC 26659 / Pp 5 / PN500) TaxID=670386 RepID=D3B826_HETP5|nr:hypothetical protein PPL_04616 [Heterostelium album PN500]EFA82194.1 hypothetical protein PPL_04616 [Heterostelium album PN500]|eukprot:XP_020434311.1 hypothetical protein PPL_04616 [Heterostelium album PN500]